MQEALQRFGTTPHRPPVIEQTNLWIFPRSDGRHHIVAKWADGGVWLDQRAYSFHTIPGGGLLFAISDNAHQNDGAFHVFQVSGVLSLFAWNHVAAVYDQTSGKRLIYVNGAEVAQRTDAPIVLTSSIADLGIGVQLNAPGVALETFSGSIDEVGLYNRALSGTEISKIFDAGSAGQCKNFSVDIDIKPDSDPNSINRRSRGNIPVAILSTAGFDAPNDVMIPLLTFGRTGNELSLSGCGQGGEDVNGDGLLDLVCHFFTRLADFQAGDTEGILKGDVGGTPIEGSDSVRIVGR